MADKGFVIYRYTNRVNGKTYVGYTSNLEQRDKDHRKRHRTRGKANGEPLFVFYSAVRKYGWQQFEGPIVLDRAETKDEACRKEVFWIAKLNTYCGTSGSHGYNMTTGGNGGLLHPESLEKIRASKRGANNPQFGKVGVRRGMRHSEETKQKLAQYRGEKAIWYGRKHSPETRAKMSLAQKGKVVSEATREKLRRYKGPLASRYGKQISDELKQRLNAGAKIWRARNKGTLIEGDTFFAFL